MSNTIGKDSQGNPIRYEETRYGFGFGACNVERVASWNGYVFLKIYTKHRVLEVTVTPKGQKIRATAERDAEKFEQADFEGREPTDVHL